MSPRDMWREFRRRGARLKPRLAFWLALCRQAGLITRQNPPCPTGFVRQWLAWPPEAQSQHLLEAWLSYPANAMKRKKRLRLLEHLKSQQPLHAIDRRELAGLQALDICEEEQLSAWGKTLLLGNCSHTSPSQPLPWAIQDQTLLIPFPPDWLLLWELEAYLTPTEPGRYALDCQALRKAMQRALSHTSPELAANTLIAILEKGLRQPLPPELRARILGQPSLHLLEGTVLEFSDPDELAALRRSPILRRHLAHLLSPRHVFLERTAAPSTLALLERRGVYASLVQGDKMEVPEPPRQPGRAKRQSLLLLPLGDVPMQEFLQRAIAMQETMDILYHAPGRAPEVRHVTPLLLETRGGHTYLIAYCHGRRANRTFRLDRIEIPSQCATHFCVPRR